MCVLKSKLQFKLRVNLLHSSCLNLDSCACTSWISFKNTKQDIKKNSIDTCCIFFLFHFLTVKVAEH